MGQRQTGAIAAGHALSAAAAAEILEDGGNAFDAVIAALAAACVCEPVLASPAGGGFLMARDGAGGTTRLIDFFLHTPARKQPPEQLEFYRVDVDFGPARQAFHIGHGAAAVPGLVPGLLDIHARFAVLPLARLLEPAIRCARDGIAVTAFQAFLGAVVEPILTATEDARAVFAPGGRLIAEGEQLTNPQLGEFFAGLGAEGEPFYRSVMDRHVTGDAAGRGHLQTGDIAAYQVVHRQPLAIARRGAEILLNPPPSSGGAMIARAFHELGEAAGPGVYADALARADAARRRAAGDPDRLLADIGMSTGAELPGGTVSRGTTHVSIIDGAGNAASATVSNGEGNGHMVSGLGFMMNNVLGEEDLNPRGFHQWRPGRRLSSMMAPALVEFKDGALAAVGSGGSNRIRSAMFQAIARLTGGEMPDQVVAATRVHVEGRHLDFEDLFGDQVRQTLTGRFADHRAWPERNLFFGGVHCARRDAGGVFSGAGDGRRGGGYLAVT